ncbi:hypothetical protein ACN27J_21995 [Solwaraspora sp. WMMB762]|uniref:hypothetical protein n=1 Tax=Solwaraspora sp. WMMB762 TaxID=3404120 RepID=UPI003B95258E
MKDEAFAAAAEEVLHSVSDNPLTLRSQRRSLVPREFLRALATAAADWPHTPPEIWYGEIMQSSFWALVHGSPPPSPDEDEKSAAETLAFGVMLSMISMDRGGHHHAAELCELTLDYMVTLPAWSGVEVSFH